MSTVPVRASATPDPPPRHRGGRALLLAGTCAGPFFLAVVAGQWLWRPGVDLREHAISLMSRGDVGWIQVVGFVGTGLLVAAGAVGARDALTAGPRAGARATPVALLLVGLGLVLAGVFVVDPGPGFPPGEATTGPGTTSWQGHLHNAGTALALNAGVVASLSLARWFAAVGSRGWAAWGAVTSAVVLVLAWWQDPGTVTLRLATAAVVLTLWLSATCLRLRRRRAPRPAPVRSG